MATAKTARSGYRDRTVRVDLEELADDCYVVLKNPALRPVDKNARRVKTDPETGLPDEADAVEATKDMLSKLIVEWRMWDVTNEEEDVLLALPSEDPEALEKCPQVVWIRLGERIRELVNPT